MATKRTNEAPPAARDTGALAPDQGPSIETVLRGRNRVLEQLAGGASLTEVLQLLALGVEDAIEGVLCSVLLLEEDKFLRHCVAPNLPDFYMEAIDGIEIGPQVGSCGAAAHLAQRVVVEDVETHPNWEGYRELTRRAGIRSCWSEPICSSQGEVLGTFAMYHAEPCVPGELELDMIHSSAQVAGIAIEFNLADKQRRALEARLRQVIDLDPHMIFAKDWDGRFLLANQALADAYGTTVEDLMGRRHAEFHSESTELSRMLHDDREVMRSGHSKVIPEETFVDASGHTRYLRTTKIPYLESVESRPAVLGIAVDITDLKLAELSLRGSEERFRQLAETIREVFWLTDWVKMEVLYVSPAYETIWGRKPSSLYENQRSWSDHIHPEDRERVVAAFAQDAEKGDYDVEYRIVRSDGSVRWIHDRAFPILDSNGRVYRVAGISEDVSDRRAFEQELQNAHDQLETRVQERTLSLQKALRDLEFAEGRERRRLAVDLHDDLGQTITLAQMKLAGVKRTAGPELGDALGEIEELVRQANRSVRSMTFQLSPPVLHDLGFLPAVQWLVENIHQDYGLAIELQETGDVEPVDEHVRVLLFRAVRELLINVAKHAQARLVRLKVAFAHDVIEVDVVDDGIGFEADSIEQGSQGLFSVRERLRHLGGRMEVESTPGKGTRVRLVAPLHLPPTDD